MGRVQVICHCSFCESTCKCDGRDKRCTPKKKRYNIFIGNQDETDKDHLPTSHALIEARCYLVCPRCRVLIARLLDALSERKVFDEMA